MKNGVEIYLNVYCGKMHCIKEIGCVRTMRQKTNVDGQKKIPEA